MKELCIIGVVLVLCGCASRPVDCAGRLQPINSPGASQTSAETAAAAGTRQP